MDLTVQLINSLVVRGKVFEITDAAVSDGVERITIYCDLKQREKRRVQKSVMASKVAGENEKKIKEVNFNLLRNGADN